MFHVFTSDSADDLWLQAARKFRIPGETASQPSRTGSTTELLHVAFELRNPCNRWITSRSPAINIAFALAEVVWIIRGRNDSEFLNYFNSKLPKFAGTGDTYHGAYGHRLRHRAGFDQLDAAYNALKLIPESRQIVLQIWDGKSDFPINNGQPVALDVPCNIMSMLKVRNGKLEWTQIMRSNDLFRGFVHNVIQFSFLQEVMAGWLGLNLGSYHHFSDSLHVYDTDTSDFKRSLSCVAPISNDVFTFSKIESDRQFTILEELVDTIICRGTSHTDLLATLAIADLSIPFLNIARILVCEGLRKRNAKRDMHRVMDRCSNNAYLFLFDRWLSRVSSPPQN